MHTFSLILAAATLGVDIGYETTEEGGVESIVQIDPRSLEVLREGDEFVIDLPAEFGPLKRYRIRIGSEPLKRELPAVVRRPAGEDPFTNRLGAETTPPALPLREFQPPGNVQVDANVRPAGFKEPADPKSLAARGNAPAATAEPTHLAELSADGSSRPWLPLIATLLALCGSLGANFYLGWLLSGQRSRYRELASRFQPAGNPSPLPAGDGNAAS